MTRVLVFGLTDTVGGIETFIKNLVLSTNKKEIIFDFIIKSDNKAVFSDEIRGFYDGEEHIYPITKMKVNPFLCISKMREIYRAGEYDVVYVNTTTASDIMYALKFTGRGRARVVMHSHFAPDYNTISNMMFQKFCSKYADAKLACSIKAAEWLYGTSDGVTVINNGIVTEKFRFSEDNRRKIRAQYNIGDDDFLIGHVGRLSPPKNQLFLIEILAVMLKEMKRMGNNINENNRIKYRNIRLLLGGVVQMRTCFAGG